MSLQIGKWFFRALRSDYPIDDTATGNVSDAVSGRIFPVGRSIEQDAEDNIPYIILSPEALTNRQLSKDSSADTFYDDCAVSVLVCAASYGELVTLTTAVRQAVVHYYDSDHTTEEAEINDPLPFVVEDYTFSAEPPQLDPAKPAFWQLLRFACVTSA